jgi:hypothetical protein
LAPGATAEQQEQYRRTLARYKKMTDAEFAVEWERLARESAGGQYASEPNDPWALGFGTDRLDPLSAQALVYALAQGVDESQRAPGGGARRTSLAELTGLPYYVPNVPVGLPAEESERLEAEVQAAMFDEWARILADRWKLQHGGNSQRWDALTRVAKRWRCSRDEAKLRLIRIGLLEAAASAGEPWSGRIGSGQGSGNVDAVPADAGVIGSLRWVAQETIARAKLALDDEDDQVARPSGEADWPSGELKDPTPGPEAAIEAEESAREQMADLFEAARPSERQKLDAVLRHLRDGEENLVEAKRRAAEDLGVSPNAINVAFSRLGSRLR